MRARLGDAEDAARVNYLPAPAAARTGPDAGTGFRTRALANVAWRRLVDRDFLLAPERGLLEGDLHVVAEIVAALRLAWVGPAAAEEILEYPTAAEDLAEDLERIMEAPAAKAACAAVESRVAMLVVERALLRIAQDFVSLTEFLEALFGGFIAGILVRVKLERELAIGLLDLVRLRIPLDA